MGARVGVLVGTNVGVGIRVGVLVGVRALVGTSVGATVTTLVGEIVLVGTGVCVGVATTPFSTKILDTPKVLDPGQYTGFRMYQVPAVGKLNLALPVGIVTSDLPATLCITSIPGIAKTAGESIVLVILNPTGDFSAKVYDGSMMTPHLSSVFLTSTDAVASTNLSSCRYWYCFCNFTLASSTVCVNDKPDTANAMPVATTVPMMMNRSFGKLNLDEPCAGFTIRITSL